MFYCFKSNNFIKSQEFTGNNSSYGRRLTFSQSLRSAVVETEKKQRLFLTFDGGLTQKDMNKEEYDRFIEWEENHKNVILYKNKTLGGFINEKNRSLPHEYFEVQNPEASKPRIGFGLNFGKREICADNIFIHHGWFDRLVAYDIKCHQVRCEYEVGFNVEFISFATFMGSQTKRYFTIDP
jgi:hypothetical protein